MTVYLGADHAGFELKEAIKTHLQNQGFEVEDVGALWYDGEDDYPDFIRPVAEAVALDPSGRGIVLGGSGQGEAMTANRFRGVRAAVFYGGTEEIVKLSREHNNANILSLGARFLTEEEAIRAVTVWLQTSFEGGRHERRINKIDDV
ncbi:MAG: RpiB/LacA/LacB family sugar-phosphate isomerase [Fidelibacterota bacterium]